MNTTDPRHFSVADFNYPLPAEKIALYPLPDRSASRLLLYRSGKVENRLFSELPGLLPPNATLLLNDTRVIEARLPFFKPSGGRIELFLLRPADGAPEAGLAASSPVRWHCLIGGASKWKAGQVLQKEPIVHSPHSTDKEGLPAEAGGGIVLEAHYVAKEGDAFIIEFAWTGGGPFSDVLAEIGEIPLPPYMKRGVEREDSERYQTVFSRQPGSVAAPTASLHFTPEVLHAIEAGGGQVLNLTLHVGAGTFQPVKAPTLQGHSMHSEPFRVHRSTLEALCAAEGPLVAVGTTVLRTLESLHWIGLRHLRGGTGYHLDQWEAYEWGDDHTPLRETLSALLSSLAKDGTDLLQGSTSLLIAPGYPFRTATGLITNFHQPQSTLLCLVAAWTGGDWKKIYDHALEEGFRFLSYGDSSLLWRK